MTKRHVDISVLLKFDCLKSYLCEASELREIRNFLQALNTPETVSLIYFDWDLLPNGDEGFSKCQISFSSIAPQTNKFPCQAKSNTRLIFTSFSVVFFHQQW